MVLSKEARALRNAYVKAWRQKNKDKANESIRQFWENRANEYRQAKEAGDCNSFSDFVSLMEQDSKVK